LSFYLFHKFIFSPSDIKTENKTFRCLDPFFYRMFQKNDTYILYQTSRFVNYLFNIIFEKEAA